MITPLKMQDLSIRDAVKIEKKSVEFSTITLFFHTLQRGQDLLWKIPHFFSILMTLLIGTNND